MGHVYHLGQHTRETGVGGQALPLLSCVALDKSLSLSEQSLWSITWGVLYSPCGVAGKANELTG